MKLIKRFVKWLENWLAKDNGRAFDIEVEKHFIKQGQDRQFYDRYENHNR